MQETSRIHSIDVLRAITLLGIIITHATSGFGLLVDSSSPSILDRAIISLLYNKCNPIFQLLFGISFYFILKNPNYSSKKFVLRCFFLILIGVCNKIFYTFDALMWYGFWGAALVLFRNFSTSKLLLYGVLLFILSLLLSMLNFGNVLFGETPETNRYTIDTNLSNIVNYNLWYAIVDYCRPAFNAGIFYSLSLFILGYWIAKKVFVKKIRDYISSKYVITILFLYILLFIIKKILFIKYGISFYALLFIVPLENITGSLFYAYAILYVYYKYENRFLWLSAYGKLGLTNYSSQGIIGIIAMNNGGLALYHYPYLIMPFFLVVFLLQVLFSNIWLQYFYHGPLEWTWRCATARKIFPNKR